MALILNMTTDDNLEPAIQTLINLIPEDAIKALADKIKESVEEVGHKEKMDEERAHELEEDVYTRIGIHGGYHLAQRLLPLAT